MNIRNNAICDVSRQRFRKKGPVAVFFPDKDGNSRITPSGWRDERVTHVGRGGEKEKEKRWG